MKTITLIIALAWATTAFGRPQIITSSNPVTGTVSVAAKDNFIPVKGPFFAQIQLLPMKLGTQSDSTYLLSVVYGSSEWLFIGGPLVLNLDGRVVTFQQSLIHASRDVERGSALVSELVPYNVKRSDLALIANASKVLAQVGGQRGVFILTLKPENVAIFRDFLARTK
jgi:hypothetical protein